MTKVTMLVSVKDWDGEYLGGEEYDLPEEKADNYILKGYAEGNVSRFYTDAEVEELTRLDQKVYG